MEKSIRGRFRTGSGKVRKSWRKGKRKIFDRGEIDVEGKVAEEKLDK